MAQPDKPKIDEAADELDWWNTYREIDRSKGTDIARLYADLAAQIQRVIRLDLSKSENRRVARPGRFELPTSCSGGKRSIQLSYGRAGV